MNVEGAGLSALKMCFFARMKVEAQGLRVLRLGCRIFGSVV